MKLIKSFYNSQLVSQKKPSNLKEEDIVLFASEGYTTLNSGLYYIKNAKVSSIGIIYKFLFSIKTNIICYSADFKKYKFRYLAKQILQTKKLKLDSKTKYIIVFDNYSGPKGFAHWLCDGLTRIAEVNDTLDEYTVLIPEYFKDEKMYLESLSFFNVKKIVFLKSNIFTTVPNLYLPSHICETGNFNIENLKKLKNINWFYVCASDDEFMSVDLQKAQIELLISHHINAEIINYIGKHDIYPETLLLLAKKCGKNNP